MNNKIHKNTILIAAGGTGGHIFPSLSIINQFQNGIFMNFIIHYFSARNFFDLKSQMKYFFLLKTKEFQL